MILGRNEWRNSSECRVPPKQAPIYSLTGGKACHYLSLNFQGLFSTASSTLLNFVTLFIVLILLVIVVLLILNLICTCLPWIHTVKLLCIGAFQQPLVHRSRLGLQAIGSLGLEMDRSSGWLGLSGLGHSGCVLGATILVALL